MAYDPPPLVSIILPVYNGEAYLREAINSCLAQSYTDIELIIVNDNSTDNTRSIVLEYLQIDKRIIFIENPHNYNLPASLNIGHKVAKGDFLTWTSDDNIYFPDAIQKMVCKLQSRKIDLVYADFEIIDKDGMKKREGKLNPKRSLILENTIGACFLYKRDVYIRNKGYNENLFKIEDYFFWLMAAKHSSFHHIPEILYSYRTHSKSLTSLKTEKQFVYKESYVQTVEDMYKAFFTSFDLKDLDYEIQLFSKMHLHQEFSVFHFLNRYEISVKKLEPVLILFGQEQLLKDIELRIRYNILRYRHNQNIKTLLSILSKRPGILLDYNKRKSLRIFYLSFVSKFIVPKILRTK